MAAALWARARMGAQFLAQEFTHPLELPGFDGRRGGQRWRACAGQKGLFQRPDARPGTDPAWRRHSAQGSALARGRHDRGGLPRLDTRQGDRSAIYAMRRVLEIIEDKIIPGLSRHSHPKLGSSTLNVGTISGGSKINIVPDKCRIEVDCRVVPGIDAETFRHQLESDLRAQVPGNLGAHATLFGAARYGRITAVGAAARRTGPRIHHRALVFRCIRPEQPEVFCHLHRPWFHRPGSYEGRIYSPEKIWRRARHFSRAG